MIENLYELIGGHRTIEAATERFYKKVLEDDDLRQPQGMEFQYEIYLRNVVCVRMYSFILNIRGWPLAGHGSHS
jgi:hypothetical protein